MSQPQRFALILAGGSGERFWPISRKERPKQLLDLFGGGTMLAQTVARLDGLVPAENILILTNVQQEPGVRAVAEAAGIPAANIMAEPDKRDTAPAIALGIGLVAQRDPGAVMAVLPADQRIEDAAAFRDLLGGAMGIAAREDALLTIGIKPTWPCPSYGYIERGDPADTGSGPAAFEVARFREKPDPELAEQFLAQGGFTWNAGMFIWSVASARAHLGRHCPELAAFVDAIRGAGDPAALIAAQFPTLTKISIDYALMEPASRAAESRVLNVEATFDWDDVGSWISVAKYLQHDADKNDHNCALTSVDAAGNIVFAEGGAGNIALLGVSNLIVVQAGDAILVADRDRADEIKKLVAKLPVGLV